MPMAMSKNQILELFAELNRELAEQRIFGEVGVVGGAAMVLAFNARESTKDVDAVFSPTSLIRSIVEKIADERGLQQGWLNDGCKGFMFVEPDRINILQLSNLRVWMPPAEYLLAMKCHAARFDSHDREDVVFLIEHLGIKTTNDVFSIVERFAPRKVVPAKTQFFVEELFEEMSQGKTMGV